MSAIHPSAIVASGATVAPGARIGPFCTVGAEVLIEEGAELVSHVVVEGQTRIGSGVRVFPFASVGLAPQDLKYKGEPTCCEVGARTVIREHCTIHRGTVTGSGVTKIGADCLLMAVVHVAHDCHIGDGVVIANNVVMGGHVTIGERAVIGGATAIHQFAHIGRGAMIGGVTGVTADVIPFGMVIGNRGRLVGLNIVGLRRSGVPPERLKTLRAAFRFLFAGEGVFAARLSEARERFEADPLVAEILDFITHPGRRGLIPADARAIAADEED